MHMYVYVLYVYECFLICVCLIYGSLKECTHVQQKPIDRSEQQAASSDE